MLSRIAIILVMTTFVVMTLLYGGVHQPVLALFYILALLVVVAWAVDGLVSKELRLSRSLLPVPLLLLGVYAVLQVIPIGTRTDASGLNGIPRTMSADPFATKLAAIQIFCIAAFLIATILYVDTATRLRRIAIFLTIFGFAYAFFAVLQSVLSPTAIYGVYEPRSKAPIFGSFVNRNDYAALMVMLVSVPLGMLFSGAVAKDKRLLYFVAVGLMATSILLSQSRGGLAAFVASVLLLVILTTRLHGKKKFLLKVGLSGAFFVAAIGGAMFVGGETSLLRISSDDKPDAEIQTTDRNHIWTVTTRMITSNMPLGVGLGAFPAVYPTYDTASGIERTEQAHNDYLQLVSDAGVIGVLLGGAFLYLLIRQGMESVRVRNGLRRGIAIGALAGIGGVLVHSLFDFVLHITAVSLGLVILAGMLVASGRDYDDDIRDFDDVESERRRSGAKQFSSRGASGQATTGDRERRSRQQ